MSSRRRPVSAPGWGDRAFPRRSPAPRFKGRFEPLASSPALTIHDVERQTYDLLMTCSDLFMKQAEHALQTDQAAAIDRAAAVRDEAAHRAARPRGAHPPRAGLAGAPPDRRQQARQAKERLLRHARVERERGIKALQRMRGRLRPRPVSPSSRVRLFPVSWH